MGDRSSQPRPPSLRHPLGTARLRRSSAARACRGAGARAPLQPRAALWLALASGFLWGCDQAPEQPSEESHGTAPTLPRTTPRNVLLITLDTTRADFLSCLGGDARNTPNIDALAARSVLFTEAASETNVTNPSHVTIMTGLRAIEHGVHDNTVAMPPDVDTLATALGRRGHERRAFLVGDVECFPEQLLDQRPSGRSAV